jgi:hypothetical protein
MPGGVGESERIHFLSDTPPQASANTTIAIAAMTPATNMTMSRSHKVTRMALPKVVGNFADRIIYAPPPHQRNRNLPAVASLPLTGNSAARREVSYRFLIIFSFVRCLGKN